MFNFFKKKNEDKSNEISRSGVYIIDSKKLIPLHELPKNGSINAVNESCGYEDGQCHTVITFNSPKTEYITFRKYTKQPVAVWARHKEQPLCYRDVANEVKLVDWDFEWRQLQWRDTNM